MKTRSMPRLIWVLVVLLPMLLLAAAACGGGGPEELEIPVKLIGDQLDPETIRVAQGDSVTLLIEVEEPGEFHLHGYDIEEDIEPGEAAEFFFVAEATGRFRITFHAAEEEHQSHNGGQPGPDAAVHNGTPESPRGEDNHDEGEEVDIGFLEVRPR